MYKTRQRLANDQVSISFDNTTGEVIELVNLRIGDNLLKNWHSDRSMPFSIELRNSNGEVEALIPAKHNFILKNSWLKPKFEFMELDEGVKSVSVSYEKLVGTNGIRNISVTYSVRIEPENCETFWTINVKNDEPEFIVSAVRFPCVFGIYLGDTWKDDELVYPFNVGEKVANPVEVYEAAPNIIGWKWQEYKYTYFMNGINTLAAPDGAFYREYKHSGPLSMMWLDYYDSEQGLYLACYDDSYMVGALRSETFGQKRPGMGFCAVKYPEISLRESWQSPVYGLAVHPGDWHWGADNYRKWRNSCNISVQPSLPDWYRKSPGMVAHYDFKYQGGGVVHRYCDIPDIFHQAKDMGLNHILISGWHKDGFDNGFPQYFTDPELGTEEEFIKGIRYVRDNGGHVIFYVNSQLCNMKYEDKKEMIDKGAVRKPNGEVETVGYGDLQSIVFATMCNGAEIWKDHLKNTVNYLVKKVGADGIYFDQLGMARPQFCYNKEHNHHLASWNNGYRKLLNEVMLEFRRGNDDENDLPILFYEGISDVHGEYMSGQLISTFFYYHTGAYPELYKYTFPEQILVDMVYPNEGLAMRPTHVAKASRAMINKAFVIGSYMWIYDLEEDNTFRRDPKQLEHLKQVLSLRKLWLDKFGHGIFKDTVGIHANDNDVMAKLYYLCNGNMLAAVNNIMKKPDTGIVINLNSKEVKKVTCYRLGNPEKAEELQWKKINSEESDSIEVFLTNSELSLIYVELC